MPKSGGIDRLTDQNQNHNLTNFLKSFVGRVEKKREDTEERISRERP